MLETSIPALMSGAVPQDSRQVDQRLQRRSHSSENDRALRNFALRRYGVSAPEVRK
jgi:hypothetical protein